MPFHPRITSTEWRRADPACTCLLGRAGVTIGGISMHVEAIEVLLAPDCDEPRAACPCGDCELRLEGLLAAIGGRPETTSIDERDYVVAALPHRDG